MYIIGDIHGQLDKAIGLLQAADLVNHKRAWTGGRQTLWFIGDYFDRGPDGVGVVELIMRLQGEAAAAGGQVGALLGNHDVLILSALRFGKRPTPGPHPTFYDAWLNNGGVISDLEGLTERHINWISQLPLLALQGDYLLAHADALLYEGYGTTIAAVNQTIHDILHSDDPGAWDFLLDEFSRRKEFWGEHGREQAKLFLELFGGRQLIHGHTPINKMTGQEPQTIHEALAYAGGLCLNTDHALYLGGRGFITRLGEDSITAKQ